MIIKDLGLSNYSSTLAAMQNLVNRRLPDQENELWLVEFDKIFTYGISDKTNYPHNINNIKIIKTDRGGKITYHGRGQLVIYLLIDLKKNNIGIKKIVACMENSVISLLNSYGIIAHKKPKMPGVFVNHKKIAALGLRVKNYKTYHGLSLNVNMDLTPFSYINPCGYENLKVCQMSDFIEINDINSIKHQLAYELSTNINAL